MNKFLLSFLLFIALPISSAFAKGGVVSSADPRASAAGQEILRKGGSATDAAMAMMLALTVVEPQSSGIGGGGFLVHHDAKTGLIDTIDGRETAPSVAQSDRFLGPDGKPLPFMQAVPGGLSVGVPGNIRLMAMAHSKWGWLPWAHLFVPAIRLAEEGFTVNETLNSRLEWAATLWKDFPEAQALYWRDGQPASVGALIKNPALAAFLKKLAVEGPDAFYTGANADKITATLADAPRNAAVMTAQDLAAYQAKERPAICGHYRVYTVCGMGPPSSGAVTVIQILTMLEPFNLAKFGKDNPESWHLIAEAMQLAYADREKYLADRDFVDVPVAGMIDPTYLAKRSHLISLNKTLKNYDADTPPGAPRRTAAISSEVHGTTHFVAVDGDGDIVSMTSTVEGPFGSQLVANGYVLNNELTDFTFAPEKDGAPVANRVEGGKRPLSSMSPTIVYDASGKPIFTIGAAGGKTIIMQVAKALIAHLDWGLPAREAIGMSLIYFNKDGLVLEDGPWVDTMKPALEHIGHVVTTRKLGLKANAAEWVGDHWEGAADPRSPGVALAE
ncbi:MAG: gamma-glutamyltransferase [Alphaproteobacteria bacterium]|nr:gamma-glutamyltransferase [Alphaproteobacteria bacterium]